MTAATAQANHYRPVLAAYLATGEESVLLEAYELGRQLMEQGLGILDIARIHSESMLALAAQPTSGDEQGRAGELLSEVLAPFEMAYRGFGEAYGALRRLTDGLEQKVCERTSELQASLAALQEADAERRRLLARIVTAQEQERRRIADDLHDDSIQVMVAVGLRLSALRGELKPGTDPGRLRALEQSVALAVTRLRHLTFELRPLELDSEGLAAALRRYLSETCPDAGLAGELRDDLEREPSPATREVLYRIAQEALVNVRKHAEARTVTVTLAQREGGVLVCVHDDGVGFAAKAAHAPRPGHLGVTAMHERAAMAGGWCRIASAPGSGTTVEFWAPSRT